MTRLIALAVLLALAVPATATEPSSGKISKASPKVTWTGQVTGFAAWQLYNQGQGTCSDPSCDTFTLEVADGPANVALRVKSGDSNIYLEVVKPDGAKELFGGASMDVRATLRNAANGTYTLNIAQNEATQGAHEGSAELLLPPPPPPPPPPAATPPAAAPPAPATLTVKVGKVSARRARGRIAARVSASAPVTGLKAVLKRGRRTVGTGSLAKLDRSATVRVKLKGRLKPGAHSLAVTATDTAGRPVSKTVRVRVAR